MIRSDLQILPPEIVAFISLSVIINKSTRFIDGNYTLITSSESSGYLSYTTATIQMRNWLQ